MAFKPHLYKDTSSIVSDEDSEDFDIYEMYEDDPIPPDRSY